MLTPVNAGGRFISILSDGRFHETVNKSTEGAMLREYELKDGTKGEKWELAYAKLEGKIKNIQFRDGDYGEQVLITFTDGEKDITVAQGVSTNFGEDILKKLPSLKLEKEMTVAPYAFTDDTNKERRGVTFYQDGEKVPSFFWDGEKSCNGYPTPDGDIKEYKSDDWKLFYLQARKFLTGYIKTNLLPQFEGVEEKKIEYPENPADEIDPADVAF